MGAASRQRHTAMLPPQKFHCLLDELPLHLIPQHSLDRGLQPSDTSQLLFLNPECLVLPAGVVPPKLETHRELLEGFHLQSTVAWVRDPGTSSLHPFWLGPALDALVSNLRTGEPVPPSFPQTQRALLAAAGILTPEDYAQRRRAEWSTIVDKRSQTFREKNYVPLDDLIHPFQYCRFTPLLPACNPARSDLARRRAERSPVCCPQRTGGALFPSPDSEGGR